MNVVGRVTQTYLGHQLRPEASLVVVGRRDPVHHPGYGVVGVTGPAAAGAHVQDLRQQLGIKSKSGEEETDPLSPRAAAAVTSRDWSPDAQVHGLGRPDHPDGQQHVVTDLGSLDQHRH